MTWLRCVLLAWVLAPGMAVAVVANALEIESVNLGADVTAGMSFQVVIRSVNGGSPADVNQNTGVTLSVLTGTGSLSGTTSGTILNNTDTLTLNVIYTKAESGVVLRVVRTSGASLTSDNSSPFTVVAGAVTTLAVTSVNGGSDVVAGGTFPVVVQAQDANGNPAPVVAATDIELTRTSGTGTLGGATGTIAAGTTSVTLSSVTYTKAEAGVVLTASRTSGDTLTSGASAAFTVVAGAATKLVVVSVNGGADVVAGATCPVVVQVQDANDNVATVSAATGITLTRTSGTGTLGGNTGTIAAGTSSVTLSSVTYTKAEAGVVLTASRTSGDTLTSGASAAFTVVAGAVTKLAVLSVNGGSNVVAGGTFAVVVQAQDANDNPAPVSAATGIELTRTSGTGTVGGATGTIAAGATGVTLSSVTYTTAEAGVVLTASRTSGDTLTAGASAAFTVVAGAATKLVVVSVNGGSNVVAGSTFPVVVQARDANDNVATVSGATGIQLTRTSGTGTLGGATGTIAAGASGVTLSSVTYTKAEAGVVLTASRTSGHTLTAGASAAFTVIPGAPVKIRVTGSATQTAGQTQNVILVIQDQHDNTASVNGAVAVVMAASGAGGGFNDADNLPRMSGADGSEVALGTSTSLQFVAGVADISVDTDQCHLRLVHVGTASITATSGALVAGTPLSVTVSAGQPSQLDITSIGTLTPVAGQATTVVVAVEDAGGNTVASTVAIGLLVTAAPTAGSLQPGFSGGQIAAGTSGTTITGVILDRAEANVTLTVADSSALLDSAATDPINVQNDQPVLSIASGQLTYAGGSGAIPFGTPGIGVSDINSAGFSPFYTGAVITASISAGGVSTEDLLQVRSAGTISVSGTTVSWNDPAWDGSPIASIAGGFAGSPLVVTFTGVDVPEDGVTAVLENLCFHNIGGANPTLGTRTITLGFSDGSGTAPGGARSATAVTRSVQVVIGNALPVIEENDELSVARSSTTVIDNTKLRVTDEESPANAVEFTVVDFPTAGDLLVGSGTSAIRLAAGGTETFTQADVDAGLLSYEHQGSSLPGDTFTFIVSDGTNQLPVDTFTITVPGADANPVLFLPVSTLTYTEGAAASVLFPAAPFASGTLVSDANTFEFSNGSLLIEIVTETGVDDPHPGDRLGIRSQSIPALAQYDPDNFFYTPEIDYVGHIAMVGTDVVRRHHSFYHYWYNNYYTAFYQTYYGIPGMFPDPGGLPFPSPSPPTSYPNSWYFGFPVPIDVRLATRDASEIGEGGPLLFSLLSGVSSHSGDHIVSAQAVAHLIDNLTFINVSDDPPTGERWLRITLKEAAPSTAVGVARIELKIVPANDAPVFQIPAPPPAPVDVIDALAGVTLRIRVLANDPDLPSSSSLTYSLTQVDPPSAGTATINATSGALDFTPLSTFVGPVTLFVRATDNQGAQVDGEVEVDVVAGPTALGPLVVSDPPFESFAGEALSYPLVIRPEPSLPAPGAGTVSVTLVGDVPVGAVINPGTDQLHPVLDVTSLVRPPDGVYTFGIRVEIDYGGTRRVGYQPVTFKVRASGAPN